MDFETHEVVSSASTLGGGGGGGNGDGVEVEEDDEEEEDDGQEGTAADASDSTTGAVGQSTATKKSSSVRRALMAVRQRKSIQRLKSPSAVLQLDATVDKGERGPGGELGAFQQCARACRGYPNMVTAYNPAKRVLKCVCTFRLREYDEKMEGMHMAILDKESCAVGEKREGDADAADAAASVLPVDACGYGPCGAAAGKGGESVWSLPGAFAYDDVKALSLHGCFRSDPAHPALAKRVGGRGRITEGRGFTALQSCAKMCGRQKTEYAFVGMNRDGMGDLHSPHDEPPPQLLTCFRASHDQRLTVINHDDRVQV